METIIIPVICDRCREEGIAGDDPFTAIRDLLAFEPVQRRAHVNNWTAEHQRAFVAALALTGSPNQAARAIGRHAFGAEQLKMAKGGRGFADACEAALDLYRERELYRIRESLTGLAEQQEQRDLTLAQTHLRALPPPFHSALMADAEAEIENQEDEHDDAMGSVRRKLLACRRLYLQGISADPASRAAWEVLVGPVDWDSAELCQPQIDEPLVPNMREPGMILTVANGETTAAGLPDVRKDSTERSDADACVAGAARRDASRSASGSAEPNPADVTESLRDGETVQDQSARSMGEAPEPDPAGAPGATRTFAMDSKEFHQAVSPPPDPSRWGPGLPSDPPQWPTPVIIEPRED
jgi:hypothetical protein